ncbi:Hypothetical protein CINCED_3A008936 [Cinara cedri]|nr:Hypothetical protein CINCED_3A008936 [Cinara cedri]
MMIPLMSIDLKKKWMKMIFQFPMNFIGKHQQTAVSYTKLSGIQLNFIVYMDNLGYIYYKNISRDNKIYLVCQNQKSRNVFCPSTAKISGDFNKNWIKTNGVHNYLLPVVDIPITHLRRNIGIAGTNSRKSSIRQVYNNKIVL